MSIALGHGRGKIRAMVLINLACDAGGILASKRHLGFELGRDLVKEKKINILESRSEADVCDSKAKQANKII